MVVRPIILLWLLGVSVISFLDAWSLLHDPGIGAVRGYTALLDHVDYRVFVALWSTISVVTLLLVIVIVVGRVRLSRWVIPIILTIYALSLFCFAWSIWQLGLAATIGADKWAGFGLATLLFAWIDVRSYTTLERVRDALETSGLAIVKVDDLVHIVDRTAIDTDEL